MKVGCWDCGNTDVELVDRPRNTKTGWKDTVDVCRDCLEKWILKNDYKKDKIELERLAKKGIKWTDVVRWRDYL